MGKIKVGKLNPGDLFEYKGVIYMAGTDLYCDFSIHTIVEI